MNIAWLRITDEDDYQRRMLDRNDILCVDLGYELVNLRNLVDDLAPDDKERLNYESLQNTRDKIRLEIDGLDDHFEKLKYATSNEDVHRKLLLESRPKLLRIFNELTIAMRICLLSEAILHSEATPILPSEPIPENRIMRDDRRKCLEPTNNYEEGSKSHD